MTIVAIIDTFIANESLEAWLRANDLDLTWISGSPDHPVEVHMSDVDTIEGATIHYRATRGAGMRPVERDGRHFAEKFAPEGNSIYTVAAVAPLRVLLSEALGFPLPVKWLATYDEQVGPTRQHAEQEASA